MLTDGLVLQGSHADFDECSDALFFGEEIDLARTLRSVLLAEAEVAAAAAAQVTVGAREPSFSRHDIDNLRQTCDDIVLAHTQRADDNDDDDDDDGDDGEDGDAQQDEEESLL